MKIAQVAPLHESVPPKYYGGTERVVSYLTEELVKLGQEVTLFASGDSVTTANLVTPVSRSLRLDAHCADKLAPHVLELEQVISRAKDFDIIHFHTDYLHFSWARRTKVPTVTTLHGRLDLNDLRPIFREFRDIPLVSISDVQRLPIPFVNWQGTIHHGIPENLLSFNPKIGKYLAFLGRISPEKRVDRAIEIAIRSGIELKIAAKVDENDMEYYEQIKPMLSHPLIDFVGEITESEKSDFLRNARALLFPIDWPEPFGLVMIESMCVGTPVIAYRMGSVPEIIENGENGFIVETISEAVDAVEKLGSFDRKKCRAKFLERFSATRMAEDYLKIYRQLTAAKKSLLVA